jgi:ribulose-5-phosphate 4-epimerase/fuculose-1-phosphate aldolase
LIILILQQIILLLDIRPKAWKVLGLSTTRRYGEADGTRKVVVDRRERNINFGALQMASIIFQPSPDLGAVIHSHSPSVMTLMAMGQELKLVCEPTFLL